MEVVDASDPHNVEHRATVQVVLDELGAGDKPRLTAYNKADLVAPAALDGAAPAPVVAGSVSISARVRERGTVDVEYGERSVRVRGRMAPVLAGELTAAAERWAETLREGADGADLAPLGR